MKSVFRLFRGQAQATKRRRPTPSTLAVEPLELRDCPAVNFLNFVEASGDPVNDPVPLLGTPTQIGDGLFFDPIGFLSQAGIQDPDDTTVSLVNFTIQADALSVIDTILFDQSGDATVVGPAGASASSGIETIVTITVTELDGQTAVNVSDQFDLTFNPADGFSLIIDGNVVGQVYDGTLTIDVNAFLAANGIVNGSASQIDVTMVTTLDTDASGFGSAFINLKQASVEVTTDDLVLGSLGDRVWNDTNSNGVQDPGETGIVGATVNMVYAGPDNTFGTPDDVNSQTVTGADGIYGFSNLSEGQYRVTVANSGPIVGLVNTFDLDSGTVNPDSTAVASLAPGQIRTDVDFGFVAPTIETQALLAGVVYVDTNNNGIVDPAELGIANVTIQLFRQGNNQVLATTKTDAFGYYTFGGLGDGTYVIRQIQPPQFVNGKQTLGTLGGAITTNQFTSIVVAGNAIGVGYNFGERGLSSRFVSKRNFIANRQSVGNQRVLQGLNARFAGQVNQPLVRAFLNPRNAVMNNFNGLNFALAFGLAINQPNNGNNGNPA